MDRPRIGVVIHTETREKLFTPEARERLESLGDVTWTEAAEPISVEEAKEMCAGARIGLGSWMTPSPGDPELMEACPELGLWIHVAGSVRHMFGPHLEGRGLTIASCKPANAANVAEFTLAELILGLRGTFENREQNRRVRGTTREELKPRPPSLRILYHNTVGIVGASEVGRAVLALLAPLGCRVLLYDPLVTDEEAEVLGAERVDDLVELCRRADAVSLHAPALPATRHMIGRAELRAMPDDGVLINTARGMCVDHDALVAELEKGRLKALLDVTEPEPLPENHPLRHLSNATVTSHIAGPPALNMGDQAAADVERWLRGEQPLCVTTEDELGHVA